MTEEPMGANVEKLIKDGIRAYKAKNRAEAHSLLEKATELDPYSEQAWLWLSAVVDTEEDQRVCLENVLYINPDNADAKKGIDKLNAKRKPQEAPPPAAPPAATPPPPAPAPAPTVEPPTATSSASSVYSGPELSGEDYDDWVAGLPLPSPQNSVTSSAAPFTTSDIFNEEDFDSSFDDPYDADSGGLDDVVGDNPFGAGGQIYDDDDEVFEDAPQSAFQSGPFATSSYDEDDEVDLLVPPSSKPATRSPEPRVTSAPRSPVGGGVFTEDLRASVNEIDEADPGEYFRMIPMEIKATRPPGTREGYPLLLILGIVGLLMANGAVLFMLINRLAG